MFQSLRFVVARGRFLPMIAAIAALAMLVTVLACGGSEEPDAPVESASPVAQPAAQATATPTPPPDPITLLAETAATTRALDSMRFAVTHEIGSIFVSAANAKATEARGAWNATQGADIAIDAYLVAGPDADLESGTYIQLNMLLTPDSYFITDPLSGVWTKRPLSSVPVPIDQIANIVGNMLETVENPQLAGQESLDGVATYRITGRAPATVMEWLLLKGVEGQFVDIEIWTDTEEKLIQKLRLTGPVGEFDDPDTVRVITLSDVNGSVSVEPPTDFIDLSELQ